MEQENLLIPTNPDPDPVQLINTAISEYYKKYSQDGRKLIKPGIKASSVNAKFVYLRTGIHLIAIYNHLDKKFIQLTTELIIKHSK